MIEEIKLLLPLLEASQNGTVWLIASYLAIGILKLAMVLAFIGFIVSKLFKLISKSMGKTIQEMCMNKSKGDRIEFLMMAYTEGTSSIYSGDASRIIKALEKGLEKEEYDEVLEE